MPDTMFRFDAGTFLVIAQIEPTTDLDLSWDETGETRENLASGLWSAFDTTVQVIDRHGVILGEAHLGQSIYENPADFFTEHYGIAAKSRADGVTYGAYFPGMVREAVGEARERLRSYKSKRVRAA